MTKKCRDCGASPGEFHHYGCDVETCPMCGMQLISCDCIYEFCGIDVDTMDEKHPEIYNNGPTAEMEEKWDEFYQEHKIPWNGEWVGIAECIEYDFWCYMVLGTGWVRCDKSHARAKPDLNRLYIECDWDQEKQRFVKRQ